MTASRRPYPGPGADWNQPAPDIVRLLSAAERTLERDAATPPRVSTQPISTTTSPVLAGFDDRRAQQTSDEQLAEQKQQARLRLDQLADARSHVRWRRRRRAALNVLGFALLTAATAYAIVAISTSHSIRLAAVCAAFVLAGGGAGALLASWVLDRFNAKRRSQ